MKRRHHAAKPKTRFTFPWKFFFVLALAIPFVFWKTGQQDAGELGSTLGVSTPSATAVTGSIDQSILLADDSSPYVNIPDERGMVRAGINYTVEVWSKFKINASDRKLYYYLMTGGGFNLTLVLTPRDNNLWDVLYAYSNSCAPGASALRTGYGNVVGSRDGLTLKELTDWQHIAGVVQADGTAKLFVNGKKLAESSGFIRCIDAVLDKNPIMLGGNGNKSIAYVGYVDEFRISKVARYTGDFTPPQNPFQKDDNTLLLYHFNGNLIDASGNKHDGVGVGNYTFGPSRDPYYSNLSATLEKNRATFTFAYTGGRGASSVYYIDMATDPTFFTKKWWVVSWGFGRDTKIPIVVLDPIKLLSGYKCGQTLYWKVRNAYGESSKVQRGVVACPSSIPSPAPSSFPVTPIPVTSVSSIPTPSPTPQQQSVNKRVFVTSTAYNGNLGGVAGANTRCQDSANAARLGGTWHAWLSDGDKIDASRNIAHFITGYYTLLDGTIVASDWDDLIDGVLAHAINMTERRVTLQPVSDTVKWDVWTNTTTRGERLYSEKTCAGWTSNSNTLGGTGGSTDETGVGWTALRETESHPCDSPGRLYCFEQ